MCPFSRYRGLVIQNFMHTSLLTNLFAFSYKSWYIVFDVQSVLLRPACIVAHIPMQSLVRTYLGNLVFPGMAAALSLSLVVACLLAIEFCLVPDTHLTVKLFCQRRGCLMLIHLNRYLVGLVFQSLLVLIMTVIKIYICQH